jgi:hypothetical protein
MTFQRAPPDVNGFGVGVEYATRSRVVFLAAPAAGACEKRRHD